MKASPLPHRPPRDWRAATWAAAGLVAACSTRAAPVPSQECEVDADCAEGVCDPFSARCVSGDERPPRANLAFDIREQGAGETLFRAEVLACDREVSGSADGFRQLTVSREEVSQTFGLYVYASDVPLLAQIEPTAEELVTARMTVEQAGRLGLPPNPTRRALFQGFSAGETTSPIRVPWPRYDPTDRDTPPPYLVWETDPEHLGTAPDDPDAPVAALAPVYQMMLPSLSSYGFVYAAECNRQVTGTVARVDLDTGEVIADVEGARVAFQYADPTATDAQRFGVLPLIAAPEDCQSDVDCGDGRLCDPQGQCRLALAGRAANNAGTTTTADGSFSTQLYTYCEAAPNSVLERAYSVTITPATALSSTTYDIELSYPPSGALAQLPRTLCIPSWGNVHSVQLPLQGSPQTLATPEDAPYTCCDVGCLPAQADDAELGPPAPPGACRGRTAAGATPTVQFEAMLTIDLDDRLLLAGVDCALPVEGPDGADGPFAVGSLRADANCPPDGEACEVTGIAAGPVGSPRTYAVRIQSPTGSVLRSLDVEVSIAVNADTGEVEPLAPITLPPRVLVRGTVRVGADVCAARRDPGDCASRSAVVLAERLAMPGETTETVPGPYLHQVATYYDPAAQQDGAFVLPLDPGGVYVLTALPAPGEDGGPAAFLLLDLRETARETADPAPLDFVLEEGILVTLDLGSFDRRTFVSPVDIGLFPEGTLMHPGEGRPVDLNRRGECLAPPSEGAVACKIRQLVPPGSNISVSQVGLARFTARRAAGADICDNGAP